MKHLLAIVCSFLLFAGSVGTADATSFQMGGDRLAETQNNDGGWDWPLDNGNPATGSAANTIGPIAMGLAKAYLKTMDPAQLAAVTSAAAFLQNKTVFSPSDGYLAAQLDSILGGTANTDYIVANFYDKLAAGTYERNGNFYDTEGYVNSIRTTRSSQGIGNLAAWDIGMGIVGATSVGYDTTAWIAGVEAEIEELDGNASYDVIGLAGGIFGLAYAGVDYNPGAGIHAAAESLSDLADILAGYQIEGGGFAWNSNYVIANDGNETIQETAYALLALNELDPEKFVGEIQGAAAYLGNTQLATGGWENYFGSGENNEITGEALWALSAPVPEPGTIILLITGLIGLGITRRKTGK